jgi:dipeptidase E
MSKIIIIGGGEIGNFETLPFDKRIVKLTGKPHPKALFIPTASGEPQGYIDKFNKVYEKNSNAKPMFYTF